MAELFGASVVVERDGNILLILREDFEVWGLPGGMVEPGESSAEAAIREVYEETGVKISLDKLCGIYNHQLGHQVLFFAHALAGEPRPDGHETLKVQWFPLDQLPELLIGWHRLYIKDALANQAAVVRRISIDSSFLHLNRREAYALKKEGKLDLQRITAEICAPISEDRIQKLLG